MASTSHDTFLLLECVIPVLILLTRLGVLVPCHRSDHQSLLGGREGGLLSRANPIHSFLLRKTASKLCFVSLPFLTRRFLESLLLRSKLLETSFSPKGRNEQTHTHRVLACTALRCAHFSNKLDCFRFDTMQI